MNKVLSAKTFIISHLLILTLSLLFLAGMYYVLNQDKFQTAPLINYRPVSSKPISFSLEINNPDDDSLSFDKSLIISGKTSPKATVIIWSDDQDTGFSVNPDGSFSKVVTLDPGLNILNITSFDSVGNSKSISKTVFYSEEKL